MCWQEIAACLEPIRPMKKLLSRRKFLQRGLVMSFGALLAAYPVFIERYLFQVNTYRIPVAGLPAAFNGFTIAHLTDLHYGLLMPLKVVEYIINTVNSLHSDIIVCTGDYVHKRNTAHQVDLVWPQLMRLKAPHGVYSVLGNHDHWADAQRSLYWLEKSGQNVRHQARPIVKNGEKLWIGGAGDYWEDALGIDTAFQSVSPDDCKILLSHNPDSADTGYKTPVQLIISGHTHGGQVVLPFIGAPILPVQNKAYCSGLMRTARTNMYISRGLGWAIIPVRCNCYPEISVLQLAQENSPMSAQKYNRSGRDIPASSLHFS
jgi:predicted MPP superfamily phosphohydrolase